MTTNQENFIETSIPVSYKERAKSLACSIQSRLRSLNNSQDDDAENETIWTPKNENEIDYVRTNNVNGVTNYTNGDNYLISSDVSVEKESKDSTEIKQDINENNIQHAQLVELSDDVAEEVVEFVEMNDNSHIVTCDLLMEEILINALNIAENCNGCKCDELETNDEIKIHNNYNLISSEEEEEEECDEEDKIPKVRRCSSLKTGKTPPGTPGRKKIVRFADVLGLDLADVRTFLDEIPKIPASAFNDLTHTDSSLKNTLRVNRTLLAMFQQPVSVSNFMEKVTINMVLLENAMVDDPITFTIRGLVRVRNLDFSKSVHIRYTLDAWKTFTDIQADYVENSCDGFSDKFSFVLYADSLSIGQRLEFAVRFQCKGCQYWDNNRGVNYVFQCMPARNQPIYDPITNMDDQIASFYYMDNNKSDDHHLSSAAVQEYITNSLQNKAPQIHQTTKPEFITILMVVFFSILFFYVKRAIIF